MRPTAVDSLRQAPPEYRKNRRREKKIIRLRVLQDLTGRRRCVRTSLTQIADILDMRGY